MSSRRWLLQLSISKISKILKSRSKQRLHINSLKHAQMFISIFISRSLQLNMLLQTTSMFWLKRTSISTLYIEFYNEIVSNYQNRFFKQTVTQINFRDVEKALLMKENLQQIIRFARLKAFVISDSSLIRSLHTIFKTCFKLLTSISSLFETYNAEIERDFKVYNEELSEKSCIEIISNRHHLELRAFSCISLKYAKKQCNFSIHSSKIDSDSQFAISLR